jgi:hypothetical protein
MIIRITLGVVFGLGVLLFVLYHSSPRFTYTRFWSDVPYLDSGAFFEARDRYRTREGQLADAGAGAAALAASLTLCLFLPGVGRGNGGLWHVTTPGSPIAIVILANLTFLGFLGADCGYLLRDFERGEFPPWADSIGIPLFGLLAMGALGVPAITVGLLTCLWRSKLPVPLTIAPPGWWPWLVTVLIAPFVALWLVSLVGSVLGGCAFRIPFEVGSVYWLLVGRAAACSH